MEHESYERRLEYGRQVNGIVFDVGADAFTINNQPGVVLTISGAGVANNSGVLQNFVNQEVRLDRFSSVAAEIHHASNSPASSRVWDHVASVIVNANHAIM